MNMQAELREVLLESWGRKIMQNLPRGKASRSRTAPKAAPVARPYDILEFVRAQQNKSENSSGRNSQ